MATSRVSAVFVIFVLLASATFSSAEKVTITLDAFNSISVCVPINVLVVPSSDGISNILIEADQAHSIRATVSGEQLSIENTDSIKTTSPIKVTVSLPAAALQAVKTQSMSDVYLAPGFVLEHLSLTTGQLGGSIAASQLTAEQLSISTAGVAKVTVEGTFGEVGVDAKGASSVHIGGLQKKATVNLSGIPEVAILAVDAGASIVGTSEGGKVMYNQGSCSINGSGVGLCVRASDLKISAAPLQWTCNAAITGSNMCHSSGSSASTFTSTGSDCPVMVWKDAQKSAGERPTTSRKLRATTTSSVSSKTPTSYTYTTTSTGADGEPAITSCSFINNKGGCQVNGSPVPVQQFGGEFSPAPGPAAEADPAFAQKVEEITAVANTATATAFKTGGTSCVFVNGIGGCQATG